MACGMCGPAGRLVPRWKVTLDGEGDERTFLTETEARIFATQNGGGKIEPIE